MPLVLYLLLVAILLGTGAKAVAGKGLALSLFRTYRGRWARPAGIAFVALGIALACWLVIDPSFAAHLWKGSRG